MVVTRSAKRKKRGASLAPSDICSSFNDHHVKDNMLSSVDIYRKRVFDTGFNTDQPLKQDREKGKGKKKRKTLYIPPFESLGVDIIRIIFDMLDSSRDLMNFALCSKFLKEEISPRATIRAAVFTQGSSRKTIDSIINSVRSRCIFTPSAFRLLRLTNGVRCERMEKCFGFNFFTQKSRTLKHMNPNDLGMFICYECENLTTARILKDTQWILSNERVATTDHWQHKMITSFDNKQFYSEVGSGEKIGPLFSLRDIKQITNSIDDYSTRMATLQEDVLEICDCIDNNLPTASNLVQLYDEAVEEQKIWEQKRKKELKRKKRESNKILLEGLQNIYRKLEELLDDNDMPFMKEVALQCTWKRNLDLGVSIQFDCALTRPILTHFRGPFGYDSPGKTTNLMIQKAASKIRSQFNILHSKDFFSFTFLKRVSNSFRRAMYKYCHERISPSKILSRMPHVLVGDNFLYHVKKKKLFTALLLALYEQNDVLEEIFVGTVCTRTIGQSDNMQSLARRAWRHGTSRRSWQRKTAEQIRRDILEQRRNCGQRFHQLRRAVIDFMAYPETKEFIETEGDNDNDFTRQDAVNKVYQSIATHRYLLLGNFDDVLRIVESYFWNPRIVDFLD